LSQFKKFKLAEAIESLNEKLFGHLLSQKE